MYNYQDITSIHLEVTSKCQARCPMCPRRLHGGPLLEGLDLAEYFITSKAKTIKNKSNEEEDRITVRKTQGKKCPRCWKVLENACERCEKVIKEMAL